MTVLIRTFSFISVFRGLARDARQRFAANNASKLFFLTFAAATFDCLPTDAVLASQANAAESKSVKNSPILEAIVQNTPGQSQGYAVGVPKTFAWCRGVYKPSGGRAPPPVFTAVTGWGQVYPKLGAPRYSGLDGTTVEIANARTYVHLSATREWILVQSQATDQIAGGHFAADFARNAGMKLRVRSEPDGSGVIDAPPAGFNDHFWIAKRGTYAAGSVDGVYVQMDMKTNDPKMKLVANVGADWWRDATAVYVNGFKNNPGAGMSNWVELSTEWSTLRFYSWSDSKLRADPPPPLAGSSPETKPALVQRRVNTSAPCLFGS